ncbi:hypothetical protein PMZ80_009158 [Knufia obscura]|uniref:P-loop containing nucleoside triphosphate hydrolase protein n=1 Tax=Knufia obscura TaxID=1635080 RepID=A0ABR0REB2_9EURO|nr:hypothetical protein PMZ80_009158 [Knufia obscura]
MSQLRTSLSYGYRCRTTTITQRRYDLTSVRSLSSCTLLLRRKVHYGQVPPPCPPQLPARRPGLCVYVKSQTRFESTATAARDVESDLDIPEDSEVHGAPALPEVEDNNSGYGSEVRHQENDLRHDVSASSQGHTSTSLSAGKGPLFDQGCLSSVPYLFEHLKGFLATPDNRARVYTCTTFDRIFPIIAPQLGLQYVTPSNDEDRVGVRSFLLKTEKTIPPQEMPSSLKNVISAHLSGDLFCAYLGDLISANDRKHMLVDPQRLWKILLTACRGYVEALPSLSIQDEEDVNTSRITQSTGQDPKYIVLKNVHYNVSVYRGFGLESTSFDKAMTRGHLDYCQQIYKAVEGDRVGRLCFEGMEWHPAEFMSRAQSALLWGTIQYRDEKTVVLSTEDPPIELWRCEIRMGDRGTIGHQALWFTRKYARLLSTLHACAALKPALQAAYRSGAVLPDDYRTFARYWGEDIRGAEKAAVATEAVAEPALPSPVVHTVTIDRTTVGKMVDTLRRLRDVGFEAVNQWLPANVDFEPSMNSYRKHVDSGKTRYSKSGKSQSSKSVVANETLPILQSPYASEIRQAVSSSQITIIKAATGSGKTTQVPQLVLEQHIATASRPRCNIVCTQPRRVAAISVARRVATERGQVLGEEVGYQVRFDNRAPSASNGINYVTSGYLLRQLEADPLETLSRYSHIMLDEVHERDIDTDLLLTALKNLYMHPISNRHKMPSIVLMSATIDPSFFEEYFRSCPTPLKISSIEVPGRTFPVAVQMLDDILPRLEQRYQSEFKLLWKDEGFTKFIDRQRRAAEQARSLTNQANAPQSNEALELDDDGSDDLPEVDNPGTNHVPVSMLTFMVGDVLSTSKTGDILVFLPGLSEIETMERLLLEDNVLNTDLTNDRKYRVFKLHSTLYETNYDVFKPLPATCRRIVLATNIAETSITLPQVRYVLDAGLSRQSSYDQATQAGSFGTRWISKAEVAQRRGRAGRTQPGTYMAAFSQGQHDLMAEEITPELLRSSLDQIVLRTQVSKAFGMPGTAEEESGISPGQVLALAPAPPEINNITAAADQLSKLHALAADGRPTAMGRMLSIFPTSPAAAKDILIGAIFRCLDPMIFFGAARDDLPMMSHPEKSGLVYKARNALAETSDDDKHADWRGFTLYDQALRSGNPDEARMIKEGYFIRHDTYCDIAQISRQVFEHLQPVVGQSLPDKDAQKQRKLPQPLFATTSDQLNINSKNEHLIKALVLSIAGTRLALWSGKNWRTALHRRVLPAPRSVNHLPSRNKDVAKRLRREPGDVLAYGSLRITPVDRFPWAVDSSVVSPLAAILFAESLYLAGTDTLMVNGWMGYKIRFEGDHPVTAIMNAANTAKVVLEYRKALDRFVAHAMSKVALKPHKLKGVRNGKMKAEEFNVSFKEVDHPVRKIIVDSVVDILNIDARARAKRAAQRLEEHRLQEEVARAENSSQVSDTGSGQDEQEGDVEQQAAS